MQVTLSQKRWVVFTLSGISFLLFLLFVVYFSLEAYLKYKIIPLTTVRPLVTSLINQEIGKAVDLGVVDFSLREGIILEDLVVSREEDFAFNANLLKVKKVTFRFSSYFSPAPRLERVDFYEPHLVIDTKDEVSEKIFEYFQNSKVPHLFFHDAKVTLLKEGETALEWKQGWEISLKRKDGKILCEFQNGIYWIPNATRISGEGEFPEKSMDTFLFRFRWKNFPTEETQLVTNYLFGGVITSASTSGEALWEKSANNSPILQGEVDFQNANLTIPNVAQYWLSGINFKEKFYFKSGKEEREFLSNALSLQWTEETILAKEPLQNVTLRFQSEDLSFFAKHIQEIVTGEYLPFGGKIRGEIRIQETGEKNKWFKIIGNVGMENFYWQSPLFTLNQLDSELTIREGNQLQWKSSGSLFGKKFESELASQFEFTRLKRTDGKFYYPLSSRSKGQLVFDKIILSEFIPAFENWKKEIQEEIRERQEKIIPEEFFYQKKVYKYLLEGTNLELGLKVKDAKSFPDSSDLGEAKGSLVVKDGRSSFQVETLSKKNRFAFNSFFAGKTPSVQINLSIDALDWGRNWTSICNMYFYPKYLSLDYLFASQGSDYYTLSKDSRINYQTKLLEARVETPDFLYRSGMPDLGKDPVLNVEFSSDQYFETEYLRNISITGNQVDLKGFGGRKLGITTATLYGQMGATRGNWSITEEEGKCISK